MVYAATMKGLRKLKNNEELIAADLDDS